MFLLQRLALSAFGKTTLEWLHVKLRGTYGRDAAEVVCTLAELDVAALEMIEVVAQVVAVIYTEIPLVHAVLHYCRA